MSAIIGLSSGYLQSLLNNAINGAGSTANQSSGSLLNSVNASAVSQNSDQSGLSPFAQLMNTLQQLQQSNPTEYQQVTQQIATNLQSAAQTAQSDGNTTEASQLTELSTDFTNASKSGQLPNVQDLAQAVGGHHHHHHGHAAFADSDSTSDGGSSSSAQTNNMNPMNIIMNTLASAGVGTATS